MVIPPFGEISRNQKPTKREVQIFSRETDEVIHRVDVTRESESAAHRIVRGMNINLDRSRYYIKLVISCLS